MSSKVVPFRSLRFPPNTLGTDEVPYFIRFVPQEVQYGGTKANTEIRQGQNPFNFPSSSDFSTNGTVDSIANNANLTFDRLFDVLNRRVGGRVNVEPREKAQGLDTKQDRLRSYGSINLYLPEALAANTSVGYGAVEMGQMGMAAVDVIQKSGGDLFRKDENGQSTIMGGIGSMLPAAIQDMMQVDDKTKSAVALARGQVSNNFSFQIFNGVEHRTFQYSFKLIAKNENESKTIKEICDTFTFFMLPSKSSEGDFHFYETPCQWDISYNSQKGRLEYFQQPKSCFMTSCNVTYNDDTGNNLYTDGAPMAVTLALDFVEIEPLYRGDRATGSVNINAGGAR